MKTLIVVSTLALLAACSTYGETQSRAPMIELETTKTPDAYLGCVSPKLAELWAVATIRDGDSQVLTMMGAGPDQIVATVTVTPAGTGSRVAYRQMHNLVRAGFGKGHEAVRSCK